MKEYEKLAISYSCNFSQFGPLDPITEAYEAGFLKALQMAIELAKKDPTRSMIPMFMRLEDLGQKEV